MTPKDKNLKADLLLGLTTSSLPEMVERITSFKRSGGQQKEAIHVLESIRNEVDSELAEDIILELMDFVTGYCSPDVRIWD